MSTHDAGERAPILVEFAPRPGLMQVSLTSLTPEELAQRSAQALENAMGAIEHLVEQANATIDRLTGNPDQLEFTFGLKLDFEGSAVIAKAGAEASIGIKVTFAVNQFLQYSRLRDTHHEIRFDA